jgi:Leucine-rich repeat (LRR) protein
MTNKYNDLVDKTKIPDDTMHFNCSFRKLSVIPELSKLKLLLTLECRENNLTELPELPQSLLWLYCCYNQLTELPELSQKLVTLWCSHNDLTELPELPTKLNMFCCSNNNIKYLSHHNCQVIKNLKYSENPVVAVIIPNPVCDGFESELDFLNYLKEN